MAYSGDRYGQKPAPVFAGYGHNVTERDRAAWQEWNNARAQEAYEKGTTLSLQGDYEPAIYWLGRAERLARDNPNVIMALGMMYLAAGKWQEAAERMERLRMRFTSRRVNVAHAIALARLNRTEDALRLFERTLQRFAPSEKMRPWAHIFASHYGRPGWCGVNNAGLLNGVCPSPVTLRLDGEVVARNVTLPYQLPLEWHDSERLTVTSAGKSLFGSPLNLGKIRQSSGFVSISRDHVEGWLWYPHDPETAPRLVVRGEGREKTFDVTQFASHVGDESPLDLHRVFSLPLADLPKGILYFSDAYGKELSGSPIDTRVSKLFQKKASQEDESEDLRPRPLSKRQCQAPIVAPRPPGCAIIVPVYRGTAITLTCLTTLLDHPSPDCEIIVVDDCSPEEKLIYELERLADERKITLIQNAHNLGYPASVNVGLRLAHGRDVIILNSDTRVAPGGVSRLREALDRASDVGTVTPLSNNATILSYPSVSKANLLLKKKESDALDALAANIATDDVIDLPTGHGFCLAVRGDCLTQVGFFRDVIFAQGYGEENDFCLRASLLGWRHIAATNVYVAHVGSASFRQMRDPLLKRNLTILEKLYPGYQKKIASFIKDDPLAQHRRRLSMARLNAGRKVPNTVLLLTHDAGGGVERVIADRVLYFKERGCRALLLRPDAKGCRIEIPDNEDRNLTFQIPKEWGLFLGLLQESNVTFLEWHHMVGHAPQMRDLPRLLDVAYDIYVHDYFWFCQRVCLIGPSGRYCGEPAIEGCEACIAQIGGLLGEDISVRHLVARSDKILGEAREIKAPSHDAAKRMMRHFPHIVVKPVAHELTKAETIITPPDDRGTKTRRICIVGAIGQEKGFDVLYELARDVQERSLPIEFLVVGHTVDDDALHATGCVRVSGEYRTDEEAIGLINEFRPHWGFIPSIWPETWCFTLSIIWKAGYRVLAFDLGAQAERIRSTGRGAVIPMGLPALALNDLLLRMQGSRGL